MDFPGFAEYPTALLEQHGSSISAISTCNWAVKQYKFINPYQLTNANLKLDSLENA